MKKIALSGGKGLGKFALVSDEDFDYLSQFTWCLGNNGYPQRNKRIGLRKDNKSLTIQMHRDVAKRSGVFNPDTFHDHIDRNKLNNQRENIRAATRSINGFNRVTPVGKSGYRGVKQQSRSGRWMASVGGMNTKVHLGTYDTPGEAHKAYKDYVQQQGLVVPL